jgi:hypothetical protein
LLVLLAILASTLLMAAVPTAMVRLTVINKSGYDVYIKLEGSAATEQFYYLTIPAGDKNDPEVKVFTLMSDVYKRTTWQCDGVQSSGDLVVSSNIRLTFTPCFQASCALHWDKVVDRYYTNKCGKLVGPYSNLMRVAAGEPTMEKVTYFKYLYPFKTAIDLRRPNWHYAFLFAGYFNYGCGVYYYRIRSYYTPVGCAFRYQY